MRFALASALMLGLASSAIAGDVLTVTDFDGVPADRFTSIDPGNPAAGGFINDAGAAGSFEFNGNAFNNDVPFPGYWEGWALSNQVQALGASPDAYFVNQFFAAAGGAASGNNYAIAFSSQNPQFENLATISLAAGQKAYSIDLTNTWYAQRLIQTGNSYGGQFGPDDYFKLIIDGYAAGGLTGRVEVDLGDYRDGKSFILDTWKTVSLLALGDATSLRFSFFSTDDAYDNSTNPPTYLGPSTPTYVAIDNFTTYAPGAAVPEPSSLALLALGVAGAVVARRRRG